MSAIWNGIKSRVQFPSEWQWGFALVNCPLQLVGDFKLKAPPGKERTLVYWREKKWIRKKKKLVQLQPKTVQDYSVRMSNDRVRALKYSDTKCND